MLSDVLLLCLVKLGPDYIKIYAEEILNKIDHYGECIIKFKHLLNKQELTEFLTTLLQEESTLDVEKLVWILVLLPDLAATHRTLINYQITDLKLLLTIVCATKP